MKKREFELPSLHLFHTYIAKLIGVGGRQARVNEILLAPQHAAHPIDFTREVPAGLSSPLETDDSQVPFSFVLFTFNSFISLFLIYSLVCA